MVTSDSLSADPVAAAAVPAASAVINLDPLDRPGWATMAPRDRNNEPARPPAPRLLSRLSHASKRSALSQSSSFEADDERSSTASHEDADARLMSRSRSRSRSRSLDTMSRTGSISGDSGSAGSRVGAPAPRYAGDDTRPTSSKELAGWYAYSFAAEVYVICGESGAVPCPWSSMQVSKLTDHLFTQELVRRRISYEPTLLRLSFTVYCLPFMGTTSALRNTRHIPVQD